MPAPQHRKFTEFREFGGLWTAGEKLLMPTEAAQVMSGCSPQPGGGLRAWYKPVVVADAYGMNALDDLSHEITGFGVLGFYADNDPLVVVTMHRVPKEDGAYTEQRMLQWPVVASESSAELRWQQVTDGAEPFDGVDEIDGTGIRTGRGVRTVVALAGTTLGADLGTWFMNALGGFGGGYREGYEGGYGTDNGAGIYEVTVTPGQLPSNITLERHPGLQGLDAEDLGPVIGHQSRLVMAARNGLMFTTPGLYDFPNDIGDGDNWLVLGSGSYDRPESHPAWMLSVPPSDLLVATHRGDLFNIQGDLGDPTVRELSKSLVSMPHLPKNTAYGPAVILPSTGPVILSFDGSFQELASNIDARAWFVEDDFGFFGSLDFVNHQLFAPNQHTFTDDERISNGMLVYDFRTKAWFTSTHPDLVSVPTPRFMFVEGARKEGGVVLFTGDTLSTSDAGAPVMVRHPLLSGAQNRSSVFEWVSSPVRDPEGRRVDGQSVEIATRALGVYGAVDITLSNGTDSETHTIDVPEGTSTTVVSFRQIKGSYIEVGVKSRSNDEDTEAPMVDFVRLGWVALEDPAYRPSLGGFRNGFAEGF